MKYIKSFIFILLGSFPAFLPAINVLKEDFCHIEYSDDNGGVYSTAIVNPDIKRRIDILRKKIEDSKNLNEKNREMISVSLTSQLLVELEVLKFSLIEERENYEKRIDMHRENVKNTSDLQETKWFLDSIQGETLILKTIDNCLEWLATLKEKYAL